MNPARKIAEAYSFAKDKVSKSDKLDDVSWVAFLISLLPIPVASQSAAVLDRLASDQASKNELDSIWKSIRETNSRLGELDESIDKIQRIAATVGSNTAIEDRLNELLTEILSSLASSHSGWEVLTKNWSFQAILNSVVDVDQASIAAINNSQNVMQNTRIHAKKTQLYADGNSSNIVDKSSFHGTDGSVSMDGLRTQGPLSVEGSSVGFGPGGSIAFGEGGALGFGPAQPKPTSAQGTCSQCNATLTVDVSQGMPQAVKCCVCGALLRTQ